MQQEVNYHRERESQLIHASSKVSDSLLRVYFLDGTFKTAFYDESTTASEIASKVGIICMCANICAVSFLLISICTSCMYYIYIYM